MQSNKTTTTKNSGKVKVLPVAQKATVTPSGAVKPANAAKAGVLAFAALQPCKQTLNGVVSYTGHLATVSHLLGSMPSVKAHLAVHLYFAVLKYLGLPVPTSTASAAGNAGLPANTVQGNNVHASAVASILFVAAGTGNTTQGGVPHALVGEVKPVNKKHGAQYTGMYGCTGYIAGLAGKKWQRAIAGAQAYTGGAAFVAHFAKGLPVPTSATTATSALALAKRVQAHLLAKGKAAK